MSELTFDSLNPYQSLEVIIADDPQALIKKLKEIRTPIKVIAIVPYGNRQAAYIMGHIQMVKKKPKLKGVA